MAVLGPGRPADAQRAATPTEYPDALNARGLCGFSAFTSRLFHRSQVVLSEELPDCGIRLAIVFIAELPVTAPFHCEQLIGNARLVECLLQPHRMAVGHDIVSIAVNRDDRRIVLARRAISSLLGRLPSHSTA